jgi:parvulin-like peptidyl-prolyl isomerase
VKSKFFIRAFPLVALTLLLTLSLTTIARAQEEGVPVVIDEVIAQVNDQAITLSMLKAEMREAAGALKERSGMTEQQAADEVAKNQPRIIANLISEQLVLQKGKEIPRLPEDVEAEVNREMLRIMKSQGFKTLEEMEAAMRAAKLEPADIRQTFRSQFMRQAVMQREVDAKIYFGLTQEELKKYYEANRTKFVKPESVELSEIYLSFANKAEADVRARAAQIVTQARGGADFAALAVAHSERQQDGKPVAPETKGKVGRYDVPSLRPEIATAVKNVAKGGVTEPLRLEDGYQIIRVDDRTPASEATYNEEEVRGALTQERAAKEREAYINTLRKEAYINVSRDYKDAVMPLLKDVTLPVQQTAPGKSATPAANKKTQ